MLSLSCVRVCVPSLRPPQCLTSTRQLMAFRNSRDESKQARSKKTVASVVHCAQTHKHTHPGLKRSSTKSGKRFLLPLIVALIVYALKILISVLSHIHTLHTRIAESFWICIVFEKQPKTINLLDIPSWMIPATRGR